MPTLPPSPCRLVCRAPASADADSDDGPIPLPAQSVDLARECLIVRPVSPAWRHSGRLPQCRLYSRRMEGDVRSSGSGKPFSAPPSASAALDARAVGVLHHVSRNDERKTRDLSHRAVRPVRVNRGVPLREHRSVQYRFGT